MNWRLLAAGVLACVLAAAGVTAGILTFGNKVTSLRHAGAFKASARLYKVSYLQFHAPFGLTSPNQVSPGAS